MVTALIIMKLMADIKSTFLRFSGGNFGKVITCLMHPLENYLNTALNLRRRHFIYK